VGLIYQGLLSLAGDWTPAGLPQSGDEVISK